MEASEVWSSIRVAPRSVTVTWTVSAMMASTVAASDSTGQVHLTRVVGDQPRFSALVPLADG